MNTLRFGWCSWLGKSCDKGRRHNYPPMTPASPTPSSGMLYLRFTLYAVIIAYLTSRMTYATTYLQPTRPFTFDHVLFVLIIGLVSGICFILIEFSIAEKPRSRFVLVASALLVLMYMNVTIISFTNAVPRPGCRHSIAMVAHASSDARAQLLRDEFGPDLSVWKHLDHSQTTAANLTADRGILSSFPEHHKPILAHLMSTYDLLDHFYKSSPTDWILVLEENAKPLPNFMARLQSAACENEKNDVVWLQGPAIIRWKMTGGIVDGTTGMMYKRTSIPRVLKWLDLDGEGIEAGRRDHPEGDEDDQYQLVAINHVMSDACWQNKLKCGVSPLVVEDATKPAHP